MSAENTFHVEMTQMAHVSHVNSPSPAHTSAVSPTPPACTLQPVLIIMQLKHCGRKDLVL